MGSAELTASHAPLDIEQHLTGVAHRAVQKTVSPIQPQRFSYRHNSRRMHWQEAVTVHPLPTITASANPVEICLGESRTNCKL
ncbi:MAG: hypothetical protein IPH17_10070 [Bacteroidales bacterium]|nr:hypothetical protein [Bacteroidales bacterium]